MQKKRMLLLLLVFFPLAIPLAQADFGETMGNVFSKITGIGNLTWLGMADSAVVLAVTRLLIWVFIFTVIFAVIAIASGKERKSLGFFQRNHAMVIAFVMATISAIFIPPSVLLAVGVGWATAVSLLLIGGPIVGLAMLLWLIPFDGKETRNSLFLKLILCLLMFWVLSAMQYHVNHLLGGVL